METNRGSAVPDAWLTPRDLETQRGISRGLQKKLRRQRQIRFFRIGCGKRGMIRYRLRDVDEWLDRCAVPSVAATGDER